MTASTNDVPVTLFGADTVLVLQMGFDVQGAGSKTAIVCCRSHGSRRASSYNAMPQSRCSERHAHERRDKIDCLKS
jgi:hypothetical protein